MYTPSSAIIVFNDKVSLFCGNSYRKLLRFFVSFNLVRWEYVDDYFKDFGVSINGRMGIMIRVGRNGTLSYKVEIRAILIA